MIDTHCHILPGLDDGPQDWEESIRIARIAFYGGIQTIVATPHHGSQHYRNPAADIQASVNRMNERLKQAGVPVLVLAGQEYLLGEDYREEHLTGRLQSLGGSTPYLLVELPAHEVPAYFGPFVDYMQRYGITVVIAHPERNRQFMRRPEQMYGWIERGVRFQATAHSILGLGGRKVQAAVHEMCRHRWIQLIASDAHNTRTRGFQLRESLVRVRLEHGREFADLCEANAEHVLAGRDLVVADPVKPYRKRTLLGRIWGGS
ncbi:hypothetical protein DNH61_13350 [Paenibacillus sambharensis]|uniref:Tyrosine-protein phosphatase n=1 Tax=Paenibacillus sambharensis TaxID=1803190 RepID=A0A2W1LKM4_9BACL|nr:CpsB/CapC family capsule biosynthesis tyrosine phosphatase [Paenibacillus sambharensis]PZD95512.1 hypothetical protein DNH61_13350 [Paenibacillus sambharensis]